MKQHVLGSLIGRLALSYRDKFAILQTAYLYPEGIGTVANDQLATKLVTTICKSHKTFVDVGAHIGSVISEVAYNDPSIRIVAIEAIPEKALKLRKKFPSVEVHSCAVGDFLGEVSFFINLKRSGFSSLRKPNNIIPGEISEITVLIKRLDEIVTADNVDVIKVDVEGAELGVLRGSTKILDKSRPTVMFESGPQEKNDLGYTKQELYDFFASKDYMVLVPNRVAHNDYGLSKDGFVESHLYPQRTTNYFAIPKERRIEIRDRARSLLGISVI